MAQPTKRQFNKISHAKNLFLSARLTLAIGTVEIALNHRQRNVKTSLITGFMLLCATISSCTLSKPSFPTQESSIPVTNTAQASLSGTPTFIPSKTLAIPSQTNTLALSSTETIITATWTPLSTLSPAIAAARLMKWLQGTPDCPFPCVGGIVPGVTSWNDAKWIMQPFRGIVGIGEDIPYKGIGGYISSDPKLSISMTADSDSIVKITVEGYPPSPVLRVDRILAQYGPPGNVFITVAAFPDPDAPFDLTLVYPNHRFIIRYSWTRTSNLKYISSCIQEGRIVLSVEPNAEGWTDSFIESEVYSAGDIENLPFKPLEQVTDMTIQEFYEEFKSISGNECINTPIRYWFDHNS